MSACNSETTESTPAAPKSKAETETKVIETPNGNYLTFSAQAKPYGLHIPVGWTVKEHAKSGTLEAKMLAKKDTIDFLAKVELDIRKSRMAYNEQLKKMEAQPMDLAEVTKKYLEGLERNFDEMEIMGVEGTKIAGANAKVATYTYLKESDFVNTIKAKTYICYHDSEMYILSFKEEKADFEAVEAMFEEMKNSFHFD